MSQSGIWWVFLLMLGVLLSLAWVGWRFFYAGPRFVPNRGRTAPMPPAPIIAPSPVPPSSSALTAAPAAEALWRRLGWLPWPAACLLLIGSIILITLRLAGYHVLGPFSPQTHERGQHIQMALEDEKLVPPPPPPPSIFITAERPSLASADRDWSKLDPRFTQTVLLVMARMRERGYPLALLEGYRSPERQDALANGERHVTNATAFRSKHQFGLAADLAPIRDGRILLSERDPWSWEAYQALGEESEAAGLTWGGRWALKDYGHVEMKGSIEAQAKTQDRFKEDVVLGKTQ